MEPTYNPDVDNAHLHMDEDIEDNISFCDFFLNSQCWLQEASAYRRVGAQQSPEWKR